MRIAYFDCFAGISGDMALGALVDAGLSFEDVLRELTKLNVTEYTLTKRRVEKHSIAATKIDVNAQEGHVHRNLKDVLEIINDSDISASAKAKASSVFQKLAEAEAKVHGTSIDRVHFHEVGAIDAQVDILGTLLAIHWLQPAEIIVSPLALGSGVVEAAHGVIPVPAPAVVELLRGFPVCAGAAGRELTTPTGAALLISLADRFCHAPEGSPLAQGWGAGTRIAPACDPPNMVRAMLLETSVLIRETIAVLETHIDHLSGEETGGVIDALMESGALDAVLVPAWMKKSRPGQLLTVIARPEDRERLIGEIHVLTGTLGVRERLQQRSTLRREEATIDVAGSQIRIKKAWLGDQLISVRPEQDDLRATVRSSGFSATEIRRLAEIEIEKVGHSSE